MKKRAFVFASILLLVCMLSVALDISLVQADVGGTGKFLTVDIVGEGKVTATKVESGETWTFEQNGTQKVGAGTVLLWAYASEGWEFSHWGGDLTETPINPMTYKTVKYGHVVAFFVKKTFTISPFAEGSGNIYPSVDVYAEYGASQTFEFTPQVGHHVSAILVDGVYLNSFAQRYTFENITANHKIKVCFSADGTAIVPRGIDVTVFLTSGASLTFDDSEDDGVATGTPETYYPAGVAAVFWNITVTPTFSGQVLVTLQYDPTDLLIPEENLRLIRGESIEALRSDVNHDLVIDGTDVSIVANAVKQPIWYNPFLDLNNDGNVTEADIHIVNENKGMILEDITEGINTDLNIIWGTTDHFSIFGVH